jgi:hypothetical protein
MHRPSQSHDQLLSLRRLTLDGAPIDFSQAFLSLRTEDSVSAWTCVLRGGTPEQLDRLEGELPLTAETLDGRRIEGRMLAPQLEQQPADALPSLTLEGLGRLLIDGREL